MTKDEEGGGRGHEAQAPANQILVESCLLTALSAIAVGMAISPAQRVGALNEASMADVSSANCWANSSRGGDGLGEIAEMMLDGTLCEQCGEYIEECEPEGFPRLCESCEAKEKPPLQRRRKEK
jgi:hypothetical protein